MSASQRTFIQSGQSPAFACIDTLDAFFMAQQLPPDVFWIEAVLSIAQWPETFWPAMTFISSTCVRSAFWTTGTYSLLAAVTTSATPPFTLRYWVFVPGAFRKIETRLVFVPQVFPSIDTVDADLAQPE